MVIQWGDMSSRAMRAEVLQRARSPVRLQLVGGAFRFGSLSRAVAVRPMRPRTLLFFNGIGANSETAASLIARFERTRVLAFDMPGVGESPAPSLPYRMCDVAREAVGLLDHLDIARADVLGVSWGGAAAPARSPYGPRRNTTKPSGRRS